MSKNKKPEALGHGVKMSDEHRAAMQAHLRETKGRTNVRSVAAAGNVSWMTARRFVTELGVELRPPRRHAERNASIYEDVVKDGYSVASIAEYHGLAQSRVYNILSEEKARRAKARAAKKAKKKEAAA